MRASVTCQDRRCPLRAFSFWTVLLVLVNLACHRDMYDQPKYQALESSEFFEDGRASRPTVPGTVARGMLREDEHLYTGRIDGEFATNLPFELTPTVLERGQERFQIFCSPCHDRSGSGRGMIVQRGFRAPPSYHQDRLREIALGHFFEVITRGYGTMAAFGARIPAEDRWAIAAYIRVLQLSQDTPFADLPESVRRELEEQER